MKIAGIALAVLIVLIGLSYAFGWIGVHQTATIGKAHQNAKRQVFEETQSYIEGKRQEALKLYKEYNQATDQDAKNAICYMVSQSFANFDDDKLEGKVRLFVENCKYN